MTSLIKFFASFSISDWLNFLAIAILLYILSFYYYYFTRENPLPGPFPLPVIGSLYQNPGHMAKWIEDLHKKHGDMFEIWVRSQRQIWLNNADLIAKTTLLSNKTAFVVRYSHGSGLEEWGDTTGISFNRVPSSWRYNRKLVENAVNSPSFLKEFTGMMQQHFGKLETYWKEIGLDKPQDIQLWVNHFISDMFYITTTGKHVNFMAKYFNSLSTNKKIDISASDSEVIAKFVTAVNLASESILFYTTVPKILRRTIYHNLSKKYHAAHDTMKELLVEIIRNRRKKIYATPIGTPIKADVLNSLIIANTERDISHKTDDEFSRPATDEEIQADLFETILASVSTTTTAFAFFIQYVGRDKNVAKKLQDEIDAVFPGDPNSECSYEGFKKLEYIEATLNESMRLQSTAPIIFRTNNERTEVGGFSWKPDTQFGVNVQSVHFSSDLWEDADKFIPERHLVFDKGLKRKFYPFGGGLHICPGRICGMALLKVLVVLFFRKYNVELVDPNTSIKTSHDFTLHCHDAIVRLRPRAINKT